MPFCHKCRAEHDTVDVLMDFDGKEYTPESENTNYPEAYRVPVCVKCRRPSWEAMPKRYCEQHKPKNNCPDWTKRDKANFLKAIGEAPVAGIIKEEYRLNIEAPIEFRSEVLAHASKNSKAKVTVVKKEEPVTMNIKEGQNITIIRMAGMGSTARHEGKLKRIAGDVLYFLPPKKRKEVGIEINDTMMVFAGDPLIRVDSDYDKFHGNACVNLRDRTGMVMQGPGGIGGKEHMLNSPEVLRDKIDRHNLNTKFNKGYVLVWSDEALENDTPLVLYPEQARELHHAVIDRYLDEKGTEECKTENQTESTTTDSSMPPTPPVPAPASAPVEEKPKVAKAAPTSSTASSPAAHIETHVHQKKGFTYHIVVPHNRVSKTEWAETTAAAREVGGWYGNRFGSVPGGYCFKDKAVAEQFMADHFGGVTEKVESCQESCQTGKIQKPEKFDPLAVCRIAGSPNIMHVPSGCELYGLGAIMSDSHGQQVIDRLMSAGIDWDLPLETLQQNPNIEQIVTDALSEKQHTISDKSEPKPAPEPEPAKQVMPETVKVDFSTPDADLELQKALALADSL